jgi:hypothetical protein
VDTMKSAQDSTLAEGKLQNDTMAKLSKALSYVYKQATDIQKKQESQDIKLDSIFQHVNNLSSQSFQNVDLTAC